MEEASAGRLVATEKRASVCARPILLGPGENWSTFSWMMLMGESRSANRRVRCTGGPLAPYDCEKWRKKDQKERPRGGSVVDRPSGRTRFCVAYLAVLA
jgi:hypothetical protein